MNSKNLKDFQEKIQYLFKDKGLLETALTHSSFANEHHLEKHQNNERLEFLGDAVLELVSSDVLFRRYPEKLEGELSKTRASLVCEPALAYCARKMNLGEYLRLGKGEDMTGAVTEIRFCPMLWKRSSGVFFSMGTSFRHGNSLWILF